MAGPFVVGEKADDAMKKRTVYECEVCETKFRKAEMAKACEESHGDPDPNRIRILHCNFTPSETRNLALPRSLEKKVPRALTVRYGEGVHEVATYHLIRVGPFKEDSG